MIVDALTEKIIAMQNPTCVGLDTAFGYLPPELSEGAVTQEEKAAAVYTFNRAIIDAIADMVPAVKVQIAYYEALGPAGLAAFSDTCRYAKRRGLIVIADAKRNDIGSTAAQYAAAFLGPQTENTGGRSLAFAADFLTVNGL